VNWLMSKPPIDVITRRAEPRLARLDRREHGLDRGRVLEPRVVTGPQASNTTWLWLSMSPGTTVRPFKSMRCGARRRLRPAATTAKRLPEICTPRDHGVGGVQA